MASHSIRPERLVARLIAPADRLANRLYGWPGNPLYQSGAIAVLLLGVLIVTGLWLLIFYRIGSPWESVARITADPWIGRWVRSAHRFASDWVLVAVAIHALRLLSQGRSWGPRLLAWLSGVVLVWLLYLCGLTGYVMVWDSFGYLLAAEGARMLDALPILSEPIGRAFAGEQELLAPFFFINLFAHIAIPLGMALVLWLHVSRVSRPVLLPPRRLSIALVALLVGISLAWPMGMQPQADPFHLPRDIEVDLFYAFWLPLVRPLSGGWALVVLVVLGSLIALVPLVTRRRGPAAPPPSVVDEAVCTGCVQCSLDCPYEAITMLTRAPGGRSELVARVDPALCVSCGICAGSCGPMAVGPAGRTGRDQLADVRARIALGQVTPGQIVVACCDRGGRHWAGQLEAAGAMVHQADCAGSIHSSVVEILVRAGAGGVLLLACPPRDCWNREGPRWMSERMFHGRDAELKPRVDRRRVRIAHVSPTDAAGALQALRAFAGDMERLDRPSADDDLSVDGECVTADDTGERP
jgi:ferredoxin